MRKLTIFVTVLSAIFLSGCVTSTMPGSATEAEICRQWGSALPTRSRADTEQTKAEIQESYAAFALTCPDFAHLIPA